MLNNINYKINSIIHYFSLDKYLAQNCETKECLIRRLFNLVRTSLFMNNEYEYLILVLKKERMLTRLMFIFFRGEFDPTENIGNI